MKSKNHTHLREKKQKEQPNSFSKLNETAPSDYDNNKTWSILLFVVTIAAILWAIYFFTTDFNKDEFLIAYPIGQDAKIMTDYLEMCYIDSKVVSCINSSGHYQNTKLQKDLDKEFLNKECVCINCYCDYISGNEVRTYCQNNQIECPENDYCIQWICGDYLVWETK